MLDLKLNKYEEFLAEAICHREFLDIVKLSALFNSIGEKECFDLCEQNKITPIAFDSLSHCTDITLPKRWKESHRLLEIRIKEYMSELDKVSQLLHEENIKLVALKNSGIARCLYPYPGSSPMGDLDVLVEKKDFRKAHSKLNNHGYVLKFRSPLEEDNLDSAERGGGAEYSANLESGHHLWFELQWRPVAGRWIRPDQEPTAEELLERSTTIEGSKTRILSPEDNLLQVCLHTAKHTYVRAPGFRLHTDVDRIVRSQTIDWTKFTQLVENLQVKTAVFFSLAFANDLLRTPIPENVMETISPNTLKRFLMTKWLQKVGLFFPDEKKWGRIGYVIFVSFIYDDFKGFLKGIFPTAEVMREKYDNTPSKSKPIILLYIYRLFDILKNRVLVK